MNLIIKELINFQILIKNNITIKKLLKMHLITMQL